MKKFYAENIPTKMKDFDVRKLEGKWYKVRGYNPKYDCYPCQTNTFKYNTETKKMETEVKLRVATLGAAECSASHSRHDDDNIFYTVKLELSQHRS